MTHPPAIREPTRELGTIQQSLTAPRSLRLYRSILIDSKLCSVRRCPVIVWPNRIWVFKIRMQALPRQGVIPGSLTRALGLLPSLYPPLTGRLVRMFEIRLPRGSLWLNSGEIPRWPAGGVLRRVAAFHVHDAWHLASHKRSLARTCRSSGDDGAGPNCPSGCRRAGRHRPSQGSVHARERRGGYARSAHSRLLDSTTGSFEHDQTNSLIAMLVSECVRQCTERPYL